MFLDVYYKLFFFLFVWLLVKLLSQSINKTIGSYKETVWSLQRCIKTKIWHTKHQFSHPPLPFTLTARLRGNWGCLPFHQKTRLVDRCGKWEASKPEWEFPYGICCSIYSSKRSNPKGLELVRKSEWNAQFPFGNSVWEFWSTFQEIPFSPEIFHLGRLN